MKKYLIFPVLFIFIQIIKLFPLSKSTLFLSTIINSSTFTVLLVSSLIIYIIYVVTYINLFNIKSTLKKVFVTICILFSLACIHIIIIDIDIPKKIIIKTFEEGVYYGLIGYPAYLESNSSNVLKIDTYLDIYLLLKKDIYRDYCSKESFNECKKNAEDASLILLNENIVEIIPS